MEKESKYCFNDHSGSIFCGSLSPDAKYAVTGGEDDKAYVWDIKTREIVFEASDHEDSVIFAAFNYNGSYLATGDMSGIIQVWNTNDKTLAWSYNMGDATWMQWHFKSDIILAGSAEGEVYMWKIPAGELKVMQGFGQRVETAMLLSDGRKLAVGYGNGVVRIFDLSSTKVLNEIKGNHCHAEVVTCIDCHLNDNVILSSGSDGKVILSLISGSMNNILLQKLEGNETDSVKPSSSDYSTSNQMDADEVEVIDENESEEQGFKGNWVEAVAFQKNVNSNIAITGTVNGQIYIWDTTNQVLRNKIDQESGVTKLLWLGNTWFFISGSQDGILRCYDGRTGKCIWKFIGHEDNILDLCLSGDGKLLLSTSDDGTARVFEIPELK